MFAQIHYPEHIAPHELDAYLAQGWFRIGQSIFTTNFVHFHNRFYSAIWLRIKLDDYAEGRTQEKLFKRNARFRTAVGPATLTREKEALYDTYKRPLPFEPSASLYHLLFGKDATHNVYNTYEITLYDGDRLIAIGFFDLGATSAAGIASVYHPAYKKYSPGKYLIYQKLNFCKKQKLQYFYPGYFVPGYAAFDYKLTIGTPALQFLPLSSPQWQPAANFSPEHIPIQVMYDKLNALQKVLPRSKPESRVMYYEFFDACLMPDLQGSELFDFPVMLFCPRPSKDDFDPIVVFDVHDGRYHLLKCLPVWRAEIPGNTPGVYAEYLLKVERELFATADVGEMTGAVVKFQDL